MMDDNTNCGDANAHGIHDDLTASIISCCFDVHNKLGAGFLEVVYRNALMLELARRGLHAVSEAPISVNYDGQPIGQFFADILVDDRVVCELKACERLTPQHEAQLVNYLTATGLDIGLLINFGRSVMVKRKYRLYQKIDNQGP
jgi:GxxExxY protein